MRKIVNRMAKVMVLLIAAPILALFAFDMVVVRPHLAQIQGVLAKAIPEDASPPQLIRELIDANSGSSSPYVTHLVTSLVYSDLTHSQWLIYQVLWQIFLPIHFTESEVYGLYATLAFNGKDYGLSHFAFRQYGLPLSHLSPVQAATTVAMTHAPSHYKSRPDNLAQRANMLLEKTGHAP